MFQRLTREIAVSSLGVLQNSQAESLVRAVAVNDGIYQTCEVSADFASLIDAIVDRYGANQRFSLAILQDTQRAYRYLPREALEHIAKRLDISRGEVYRLATFFAAFSLQPK